MKQLQTSSIGTAALSAALLLVMVLGARSHASSLTAEEVKARYIYNFIKYVSWPVEGASVDCFPIATWHAADVESALSEVVKGKSYQSKPLTVVKTGGPQACGEARVVYIGDNRRETVSELLKRVPEGTLTIGEGPWFLARGGMVEFNLYEGKIRFSVNVGAMREAGLQADARLLSLAQEVRGR